MPRRPTGDRPMTAAERQRRYRDRCRGGPPTGRWPAGRTTLTTLASMYKISRTQLYKARVVQALRPDLAEKVVRGDMRLDPAYRAARQERDRLAALTEASTT